MVEQIKLPALILLGTYNGVFPDYFEAVYVIFKRDFVDSKPVFKNKPLRLKAHPFIDGKEYTFYHFTHSGDIEKERLPDLRRMERIGWPRPMIDNSHNKTLKVWQNKRGNKIRILIFHEIENYLVILEQRKTYILPWTAYYVEYPSRKERLLKEYKDYLKTKTA
jgi:hypothetical protein